MGNRNREQRAPKGCWKGTDVDIYSKKKARKKKNEAPQGLKRVQAEIPFIAERSGGETGRVIFNRGPRHKNRLATVG